MKNHMMQSIRDWTQGRAGRFLLTQLAHTLTTVLVLAAFLLGAARVGALDGVLAPLAGPTDDTSFTTINYQGRLADSAGAPINNTNPGVGMTFALYDVESGGSPLWVETHANVPVAEGLFSVRLGSIIALDTAHLTGDRWLAIQVGTDPEMTPREKLSAVPYAMQAGMALTVLDDSITQEKIAAGAVNTSDLASDAVTGAKIAAGAVGTSDLASNAVTGAKIAAGTIGASDLANGAVTPAKAPYLAGTQWSNRKVIVATWVGSTNSSGIATIDISSYGFSHVDGIVVSNGDDNALCCGAVLGVYDWNTSRVRVRVWRDGAVVSNYTMRVNLAIMGKY